MMSYKMKVVAIAVLCCVVVATALDCVSSSETGDVTLSGPNTFQACAFTGTMTLQPASTVEVSGSGLSTSVSGTNLLTIGSSGKYILYITSSSLSLVGTGGRFLSITAQVTTGSIISITDNDLTGQDAWIEAVAAIVDVTTFAVCENRVLVAITPGTTIALVRLLSITVNGVNKTINVSSNIRSSGAPTYDVSASGSLTAMEVVGDMQVGNEWSLSPATYALFDGNVGFQSVLVVGRISASWNCALISVSRNIIRAKNIRSGSPVMLGEALGLNLQQRIPPLNISNNDYHLEQTTATADPAALIMFAAIYIGINSGGSSKLDGLVNVVGNNITMIASVETGALHVVGIGLVVRDASTGINGMQTPLVTSDNTIVIQCGGAGCVSYAIGMVGGGTLQMSINTQGMWDVNGNSGSVLGGQLAAFWLITSILDISQRKLTINGNSFTLSATSNAVFDIRLDKAITIGGPFTITNSVFYHDNPDAAAAMVSFGGDLNAGSGGSYPLSILSNRVVGGNPLAPVVASSTQENVGGVSTVVLCANDMSGRVVYGSSNSLWVADSCGYPANASIPSTTATTLVAATTVPASTVVTTVPTTSTAAATLATTATTALITTSSVLVTPSTSATPTITSSIPPTTETPTNATVSRDSNAPTIGTGVAVTITSPASLDTATTIQIAALLSVMACRTVGADPETARYLLSPLRIPGSGVVRDLVGSVLLLLTGCAVYFGVSAAVFQCVRRRGPKAGDVIEAEDMIPGDGQTYSEERAREAGDISVFRAKKWLLYPRVPMLLLVLLYPGIVNESARILFGDLHADAEWWGILLGVMGILYALGVLGVCHWLAYFAGSQDCENNGADANPFESKYRTEDTVDVRAPPKSVSEGALSVEGKLSLSCQEMTTVTVETPPGASDFGAPVSELLEFSPLSAMPERNHPSAREGRMGRSTMSGQSTCELELSPQTHALYAPHPGTSTYNDAVSPGESLNISGRLARPFQLMGAASIREIGVGRSPGMGFITPPRSPFRHDVHSMHSTRSVSGSPQSKGLDGGVQEFCNLESTYFEEENEGERSGLMSRPDKGMELALRVQDVLPCNDPQSDVWFIEYRPEDVARQLWIIRHTLLAVGHWNTFVGRSMYSIVTTSRPRRVALFGCHNLWRMFLVSMIAAISPSNMDDCRFVQGSIVAVCLAHGLLIVFSRVYRIPVLNVLQGLQSIFLGLMACAPFISDTTAQDGIGNTLLALSLLTAFLSIVAVALEFQLQRTRDKDPYRETEAPTVLSNGPL